MAWRWRLTVPTQRLRLFCPKKTWEQPFFSARARATCPAGLVSVAGPGSDSFQTSVGISWHFWNWTYFRRCLRAGRIAGLAVSLYGVGYAAGSADMALDPEGALKSKALSVLESSGATDESGNVTLCDESSEEVQAVRRVLPRVLAGAREQVSRMERALEDAISAAGGEPTRKQESQRSSLASARAQIFSWRDEGYLVADIGSPNAFITSAVPRLIFVHRGIFRRDELQPLGSQALLVGSRVAVRTLEGDAGHTWREAKVVLRKECEVALALAGEAIATANSQEACAVRFVEDGNHVLAAREDLCLVSERRIVQSDEQLAMLLGHELAHVVHDHSNGSMSLMAGTVAVQLVLFSILDPTGLLSFLIELGSGAAASYGLLLPVSRCHESEADATGLQICALAGYDPRRATKFFDGMLAMEVSSLDGGPQMPSWSSTHPSTKADAVRCFEEVSSGEAARFSWRNK
ncbi:unnamed protein product [Polarella glacialis]|uniref:Peptidase M48 domain-containing protein n=1 Tax=Polarella glacialis TaxID=89957 RepID=A0A813IZH2_POLGL|nr:unnamed protein product [Polarella glacialis]